MQDSRSTEMLYARAEAGAALLEAAATMLELDGIGLAPADGHVQHLRRMAGSIRAQAALGRLAHSYAGSIYLSGISQGRH